MTRLLIPLILLITITAPCAVIAQTITGTESIVISATVLSASSGGGGGGGGGGGSVGTSGELPSGSSTVIFSGRAYPRSSVTLLRDARVVASTVAGPDAKFSVTLQNVTSGNYVFSMYGEDKDGIRSSQLTFPVSVASNTLTNVSGIFIAPTIAVNKREVRKGDTVVIFGQTAPQSEVTIVVNSEEEIFAKSTSDASGAYLHNFDTSVLEVGDHSTRSKTALLGEISSFSAPARFKVGTVTVPEPLPQKCSIKGDINGDCKVNLLDFSITAFWYKRILSAAFIGTEKDSLNGNAKVDLVDFSILAYYWTG